MDVSLYSDPNLLSDDDEEIIQYLDTPFFSAVLKFGALDFLIINTVINRHTNSQRK